MDIIEVAYSWKGELKKRTSTDFLILHHAEASHCTVYDIHSWHVDKGFIGFGYNFFVDKAGQVFRGRPIGMSDADAFGYNDNSLSICFEGDFEHEYMGAPQMKAGIELIKYLLKLYPEMKVLPHREVNSTRCPGENFPMVMILEGVEKMDETKTIDPIYKNCVDLVAAKIGLNTPQYWYEQKDENVKRLIELMANYIYTQTTV